MKKKTLLTICALVLVVALSVAGTVAWLTDTTGPVVNTFTVGKVDIDLTETNHGPYQLIPGNEYAKNPIVTVKADSEDCYLFVKFAETGSPATYLDYTSNLTGENGWTKLTGVDGVNDVWYRVVTKNADNDQSWNILLNNAISIKDTVTNENMNSAAAATLTFTAYAVQAAGSDTAAAAWLKVNP